MWGQLLLNNIQRSSIEKNLKKANDNFPNDDLEIIGEFNKNSNKAIAAKLQSENTSYKDNMMCNWNRMETSNDEYGSENGKNMYLDFEDFVKVMKDKMLCEKNSMQGCDIVFESESSNVSCLFWPY